jgi:DNA-binding CsgD family transcriptional regulator
MSTPRPTDEPTPLSQRELDVLKVLTLVLQGQRTQVEAARLLDITPRQVRRLLRKIHDGGDAALRHGLRGRPSNRQVQDGLRRRVLEHYRLHFHDFGPTLAREKLAERGLHVGLETLRRWLVAEGLWQPRQRRDTHRRRRPRRDCFGELVQMDTSIHDWTEGRGEPMVLVNMIDDATSRVLSGFYQGETVEAHFDLLGQWLRRYGRPVALYTDRDSIFEYQSKGRGDPDGLTQFGRALQELDIGLILARSPQAKGRVERFFETAQDRWVKEMRLAEVTTRAQANALARGQLIPEFNRRFTVTPASANDAHRPLGRGHNLAAILSIQHQRVVTNDYTIRFENRTYQVDKPVYPGLRQGRVVIELRLDGTRAIRFGEKYLKHHEITARGESLGDAAPQTPRSLPPSRPMPGEEKQSRPSCEEGRPRGVQPTGGRSGCTPAEPYPPQPQHDFTATASIAKSPIDKPHTRNLWFQLRDTG